MSRAEKELLLYVAVLWVSIWVVGGGMHPSIEDRVDFWALALVGVLAYGVARIEKKLDTILARENCHEVSPKAAATR